MKIIMLEVPTGEKAHIGPFETQSDAWNYAAAKFGTKNAWWVVDLQPPGAMTINLVKFTGGGQ